MTAERLGGFADKIRARYGRRVDRDLVGPGAQSCNNILDGSDAAAHRQRHKDVARRFLDHRQNIVAAIKRCHGIHVYDLVDAGLVIAPRHRAGLADDPKPFEVNSLDDIRTFDIEPGDDTGCRHDQIFRTCALNSGGDGTNPFLRRQSIMWATASAAGNRMLGAALTRPTCAMSAATSDATPATNQSMG